MTDTITSAGVLEATALEELREGFRGEVMEPGSTAYDESCTVFNGMFGRRPAAILRPAGTADVIRAIGLARLSGLPLAIRGGGHSVAGFSMCEGGIVIDTRSLKGIRVDPNKKTARAQAGVNWGEFDRETQAFGLATTGGRVTTTGVPGFTLGSGSGWLERKHGFAADNLISADLVTAEGEVVTATEDENAELLWGLRGGGGNFGVVTEMEFRLHDVGPTVYGGLAAFDPEQSRDVIGMWRDISENAPEALGWAVASITAPPAPFVPHEWQGKRVIAVAGQFAGDLEEAERLMKPLRGLKPIVDLWQPMPYLAVQGLLDPGNPYGARAYWRAYNVGGLDESAIDTFIERAATIPSPLTAFIMLGLGGAISRVGENDTALSGRDVPFNVHLNGIWETEAEDEENVAWVRETTTAFEPYIVPGMALNFTTEITTADIEDSFGDKLQRLRKLKSTYDPTNLFRLNQNIPPA
ncbi:MAG TPA: FAD-binding oxidoreductase [Gaiellaceae bacterium]|jgi:FAD/FMN-containing dehydrogenase|nr:FAD-binding oxidoreductase [Gaiellaceae bacterium]